MNILFCKLSSFYPYEQIHAANSPIQFYDKDLSWYDSIKKFLEKYEPDGWFNCQENWFHLNIDNKITLKLECRDQFIYLTYWDNAVYISAEHYSYSDKPKFCTVKLK